MIEGTGTGFSGQNDLDIPARRLAPKDHLARAAKSRVGSEVENYHLLAAIAESLMRIEEHLRRAKEN